MPRLATTASLWEGYFQHRRTGGVPSSCRAASVHGKPRKGEMLIGGCYSTLDRFSISSKDTPECLTRSEDCVSGSERTSLDTRIDAQSERLLHPCLATAEVFSDRACNFPHLQEGFVPSTVDFVGGPRHRIGEVYQRSNERVLRVFNRKVFQRHRRGPAHVERKPAIQH